MRRPRHPIALLTVAAGLTLAACGGGDDDASGAGAGGEDATVTIKTFDFQPDPLVVSAGTTIRFVNEDAIDHTVTAGSRSDPAPDVFDGTLPDKGATFEVTLDEAGTYEYFCRIHPGPGMTGSITVE